MLFIILLAFLAIIPPISCWGSLGHRTVAYLAEEYFTEQTSQYVNELLDSDQGFDISDAALFADQIRFRRPATKGWHFIDAQDSPPESCGVNYKRDCHTTGPGCIISAIVNMTSRVNDPSNDAVQKKEALMFIVHFLGDIHQPLHTENMERGGNLINVCFDGQCSDMNLHSVWDTEIPVKHVGMRHHGKPAQEKEAAAKWAKALHGSNQVKGLTTEKECRDLETAQDCALVWATEANSWVCKYVLKNLTDQDLGGQYFDDAAPIVDELIGKAGLRLGAWLNALAAAQSSHADFVLQKPGWFPAKEEV